ncbi:MAG TPA: alpha/beta hydrolase [Acidimicrobiales bacterium]|nr:alpha/beta hydrolase [Acidimicrobiales bacterium]
MSSATHNGQSPTLRALEQPEGPEYNFFTIHGYRRAFLSAGQGPPLLLIHGIGDSSSTWLPVVESFAGDHRVIAPDLLGHGLSDKPRADYSVAAYANGMRDLLSVLDIDRVTVVGHSLGGGVAAQFGYTFPERCERLVLVGTGGIARSVSVLLRLAAAPNADLFMPTFGSPVFKFGARMAAHGLRILGTDLGRDTEEILKVFDALPDAASRRAILRTLRSGVDWRGQVITMLDRAYLAEGMPTLLLWGAHDAIIPVEHAYLAAEALPGSRLEIFEDAGHFPHRSDPERFVSVVRSFLDECAPSLFHPDVWRDRLRRGQPVRTIQRTGNADGTLSGSVKSGT